MNYKSQFPDFITIQRTSFCWFLNKGLIDELNFFSKIFDFSQNTEYILYGNEYKLLKPSCTLAIARKYSGNYRIQIVIPIEIRNRKLNTIYYYEKFPLVTLPLMTNSATFIINGCERVIVSQIIRSPGLYFEKLKNQSRSNFKHKSSTDISKLRIFLPSGLVSILNKEVIIPSSTIESNKETNMIISKWNKVTVPNSLLKTFKTQRHYQIINLFTVINIFISLLNLDYKNLRKLILKIFKIITASVYTRSFYRKYKKKEIIHILKYLKILLKFIQFSNYTKGQPRYNKKNLQNTENKFLYLCKSIHFDLNKRLFVVDNIPEKNNNYSYSRNLVNQLNRSFLSIYFLNNLITHNINLTDTILSLKKSQILYTPIFFSKSLKDQVRYVFKKKKLTKNIKYQNETHPYTKSKTRLLVFKDDHFIKTLYHQKYNEKELYTGTLIPEYGSWIRFIFQKNLKLNSYKYPIKNQEEDIIIQLDKITQKPIIYLLKEIGLNDFEIFNNLEHREFFYFTKPLLLNSKLLNQPLLRFDRLINDFTKISEFSKIFDPEYYRLGKTGRLQINRRLNIDISYRYQAITYEDIFAIIDKLITLTLAKTLPDDIDHLKNRRVRSIGELLQNLFRIGFQRLVRKLKNQTNRIESNNFLSFNLINVTIKEFFSSSQLSQYLDQTNPLSSLTHRRRISGLGPGGFERDRISFSVRDIHPSHYGRICPIETPEGQNVGLISSLTTCARVNKLGFLETPFWRVINGKILKTGNPIYLTADIEDLYKIAPADLATTNDNYLIKNVISVRYKQDFISVSPSDIDFIAISTIQVVSVATSLIPFFEHDDANRALMGSNMQRQSVPLMFPQKPIVGTGLENQIAIDSGMAINSQISGIVNFVDANKISIKNAMGKKITYKLQKYLRSNQQTCINQRPIIWKGEKIKSGQILTDGPAITSTELALGQNILVGYMPWQGYNFEDAILISERLVYDNIFTSIHIERYKIEIDHSKNLNEETTKNIPNLNITEIENLNEDGIIKVGTMALSDDILVGKVIKMDTSEQLPESKLLRAIFGSTSKDVKDNSYRMPIGKSGRVVETISFNRRTQFTYKFEKIYIFIAQIRKIKIGDKIAGRHGNKGIISRILPRHDMPFLPDGTPIDIILNPLGVPSRMNVGQLYECLLGLAGDKLGYRFKILPFDEMYGLEISRILINKKLRKASIVNNQGWLFNPYTPGKVILIDGRTGKEFENPITVGNAYMLKLIHLVDDKMHARATGPYSLITQQPLRGKAQQGGQRFGEMEVWALEGFGAAFTLKELLTVKSDDIEGRNATLTAIVKGEKIPNFGIPESFKVLLQELRSIGLDMSSYNIGEFNSRQNINVEINLIENYNSTSKTFFPNLNINDISF